ncbi:MAG: Lrp/AsnC family transcriptional regulator [Anaerovoracaceae bacterium]|nr:Lrp/AsnC family transcriptional regulator [Anaerovoracaceae bacterium]
MRSLDEVDKKILNRLRQNGRISLKELSAEVFLTMPAVSARIEKLEREGYIKGYHAEVNLEKLGYGIKAFILITVKPEDNKKFYEFVREERCILECSHITGNYSMILKAVFSSTTLLDEFLGKLQSFGKTETHVVFSTAVERY